MSDAVELSNKAYIKVVLHAAKYPSCKVLGFLLSSSSGSDVVDVAPVAHAWTGLSPVLEAGGALVETWAGKTQRKVVGLYEVLSPPSASSSTSGKATGPSLPTARLARRLAVRTGEAVTVWVVDAAAVLDPKASDKAVSVFSVPVAATDAQPFTPSTTRIAPAPAAVQTHLAQLITNGRETLLVDFEDSLADPKRDWLGNNDVPLPMSA